MSQGGATHTHGAPASSRLPDVATKQDVGAHGTLLRQEVTTFGTELLVLEQRVFLTAVFLAISALVAVFSIIG